MKDYRIIKNQDADEVLFILREYCDTLCKAEAEFTKSIEANSKKLGWNIAELAKPIQMANDMRIKKIQRAIEIMTLGSEE